MKKSKGANLREEIKSKLDYQGDMDKYTSTTRETIDALPAEKLQEKLITFEKWYPLLQRFGDPDDMTVDEMLNRASPLAMAKLVELLVSSKSEKIQSSVAKDILHMGGYKPVEKSQSINVNIMQRAEATSLLQSKLEKFGIDVIDGELVEEISVGEVVDEKA